MKKLALKRFSNHLFLKRLGHDLLTQFLACFPGLDPPQVSHTSHSSHEPSQPHSVLDYYSALAAFFLRPERLPPAFIEELLAIEEMSTPDGLARLQRSAEWPRLQTQLRPDSTAEDIAMQIWLLAPEMLAREHNVLRFRRLTSFEHAAHPLKMQNAECRMQNSSSWSFGIRDSSFPSPDHLTIFNLTAALDRWFAFHARGAESTQVDVYPMDGELWFIIRHGDLFKRVAKVDRQRTDTVHFRPQRDDVVVLSPRFHELRVNARTKAERDLYIREFGLHVCGDANYFSERRPYTLDPLRALGRDALDPDGLEGICNIRLCKLAVRLENPLNETITREADDLFSCAPVAPFQSGPIPLQGVLQRALFEIQFTGSLKSHPVEIRVPNTLKLSRRCDTEAVQNWLCTRGFRRQGDSVQYSAYSET